MRRALMFLNLRLVHAGEQRCIGASRGDDQLARDRIRLLRHRAATTAPLFRRFADFADFRLRHENNVLRHLAERSCDETQPAGELHKTIALRMPRHRRHAYLKFLGQFFRDGQAPIAQSGQRPGSAAELDNQQTRQNFLETLQMTQERR